MSRRHFKLAVDDDGYKEDLELQDFISRFGPLETVLAGLDSYILSSLLGGDII